MYMYMYIYVYIYMYMYIYIYMYMYVYVYVYITYVYIYIYIHKHIHIIYIYITYILYVYIYIYICTPITTYMYIPNMFFVRHLFFCTPWPPRMAQRFREVTLLHPTWMYHRKIWAPGHRDTCCRGRVSGFLEVPT